MCSAQRVYDLVHDPIFDKPLQTMIQPKGDIKLITKIYTDKNGNKSFKRPATDNTNLHHDCTSDIDRPNRAIDKIRKIYSYFFSGGCNGKTKRLF